MNNRKIYIIAIVLFVLSVSVAYLSAGMIFHFQPVTTDENSYVFDAKLLLKGKFYVEPPPLKDFFRAEQIVLDKKWFSRYSPGHSIILIPGILLNFKNLMPVIMSSLMVVMIYLLLCRLTGNILIAAIAGVFAVSSPLFIIISGTILSHTSCEPLIILYIFLFFKNRENNLKGLRLPLFLGFIWSFAFIIRQYTCLLATAPFILYHLYICVRGKAYKNFLFFIIGSIPPLMVMLYSNYMCTGNPFLHTFLYYDPEEKIGFGLRFGGKYLYTPYIAVKDLITDIKWLNEWILGIPVLSPLLILSIIFSKDNVWKRLFILSILSVIAGQFFYYCPGLYWIIPNYHYPVFPISLMLLFLNISNLKVRGRPFVILITVLVLIPLYAVFYPDSFRKKSSFFFKRAQEVVTFNNIIKENNIHNSVLFIKVDPYVVSPPTIFINNPPFLDNDNMIVHDLDYADNQFMFIYPERKFYKLYFTGDRTSSVVKEIYFQKKLDLIMDFDSSFGSLTGKRIPVSGKKKFILYARKSVDKPDSLLYGPYLWLPAGEYECIFNIRAARISSAGPVAKIDVCADFGKKVFAERILGKADFRGRAYESFFLRFTIDNPAEIETRVYFYGNADVMVKKVYISKLNPAPSNPANAETRRIIPLLTPAASSGVLEEGAG